VIAADKGDLLPINDPTIGTSNTGRRLNIDNRILPNRLFLLPDELADNMTRNVLQVGPGGQLGARGISG